VGTLPLRPGRSTFSGDSRGSESGASQAPASLLDSKGPRSYQGVFLFYREIEGIANPYKEVHWYLATLARYEVLQKKGSDPPFYSLCALPFACGGDASAQRGTYYPRPWRYSQAILHVLIQHIGASYRSQEICCGNARRTDRNRLLSPITRYCTVLRKSVHTVLSSVQYYSKSVQ
jgi:hypothetical protein